MNERQQSHIDYYLQRLGVPSPDLDAEGLYLLLTREAGELPLTNLAASVWLSACVGCPVWSAGFHQSARGL